MEMTQKLKQTVKEYKAGNAESFECLYKESEKYIYTCIYKIMSSNSNALDIIEEVMQETYLEIFLNISQLENEDRFLSWAGTIANRKCFAYIKKNKKYVLLDEEDDTFEKLSDSDEIIPEEVMQSREKQRLVREIIDTQLTEVQKICVYEFFYNQKKQSEIAELYGMPVNTVKTNLSRAKTKIGEGIVYLEKKKDTKLYSFTPLFVLLFTEDVMAAEVPAEISESVLSGVTDAAAKAGLLGKIAVASTKAKIIIAVAAVSVAGAIGGGVMAASQSGLFANNLIIYDSQMVEDNQMIEGNQIGEDNQAATGTPSGEDGQVAVVEQVAKDSQSVEENQIVQDTQDANENLPTTETEAESTVEETVYTEYFAPVHFRVAYLPEELINGEDRSGSSFFGRRYIKEYEDGTWDVFYLRAWPEGDIETSRLDLNTMSDAQIGAFTGGTPDYSTLQKIKTEDAYIVYIEYDVEIDKLAHKGYDLYINDYTTGKAYSIAVNRTVEYYDSEQMLSILQSLEILD